MTDQPPNAETNVRAIWLGLALGIAPGLLNAFFNWRWNRSAPLNSPAISLFFLSISLWPVAAIILACVRRTRRFGLGMLIGVGLGWLIMLAICGGLLRMR